jgi:hypothetical protein
MPLSFRPCLSILTAVLLLPSSSFAFDMPLSDQAVREAYFLGQRHDASFLSKYIRFLPPPKTGPYISSVAFLTPFAQLALLSDHRIGNYSAQQARLDHLGEEEFVKITVEIYLTASYGALIPDPAGSPSGSSPALIPRPYDFWKDFRVQVYNGNQLVSPSVSGGHPLYRCGRRGPCRPIGAALELEFPADAFTSDSATIEVLPPEGDPVSVDFNLSSLRRPLRGCQAIPHGTNARGHTPIPRQTNHLRVII